MYGRVGRAAALPLVERSSRRASEPPASGRSRRAPQWGIHEPFFRMAVSSMPSYSQASLPPGSSTCAVRLSRPFCSTRMRPSVAALGFSELFSSISGRGGRGTPPTVLFSLFLDCVSLLSPFSRGFCHRYCLTIAIVCLTDRKHAAPKPPEGTPTPNLQKKGEKPIVS